MPRRKKLRRCLLAAILLVMAAIFLFSAQTGEQSRQTSDRLTEAALRLLVPGYGALSPAERQPYLDRAGLIIRKLAHFSEFALLGGLLLAYIWLGRSDARLRPALLPAWGVAALYACTDELHQMLVAGRGPSAIDGGIDSSGALAGAGIAMAAIAFRQKNRN